MALKLGHLNPIMMPIGIKTYINDNEPLLPSFVSVQAWNCTLLEYYSDLEILGVNQGPGV